MEQAVEMDRSKDGEHAEDVADQVVQELVLQERVVRRLVPQPGQAVLQPANQHHGQRHHGDVPRPGQHPGSSVLAEHDCPAYHCGDAKILEREERQVRHVVDGPQPHDLFVQRGLVERRPRGGLVSDGHTTSSFVCCPTGIL
jgi:hypothetical protein